MVEVDWVSEQSKFYDALEAALIQESIISDTKEIINNTAFIEFGLFSFLAYRLFHQQKYYKEKEKEKDEKEGPLKLSKFNLNIVGLDEKPKTIFLLSTDKDKFLNPYLEIFIKDPLESLPNGDKNPSNCLMFNLIKYNAAYLGQNGIDVTKIPISNCEACFSRREQMERWLDENPIINNVLGGWWFSLDVDPNHISTLEQLEVGKSCLGCVKHRELIKKWLDEHPEFCHVLGGWAFPFDVNPKFLDAIESLEEGNMDASYNYFLSLYLKENLRFDNFFPDSHLAVPFRSHEVDCCMVSDENTLIIIENNVRIDNVEKDLKTKLYNVWSLNKVYERIIMFYISFGHIEPGSHISTFIEFQDINTLERGSFELIELPSIFKNLEENLGNVTKKDLIDAFTLFLDNLQEKINNVI